jgi:hypothetical protein
MRQSVPPRRLSAGQPAHKTAAGRHRSDLDTRRAERNTGLAAATTRYSTHCSRECVYELEPCPGDDHAAAARSTARHEQRFDRDRACEVTVQENQQRELAQNGSLKIYLVKYKLYIN